MSPELPLELEIGAVDLIAGEGQAAAIRKFDGDGLRAGSSSAAWAIMPSKS